MKELAHHLAVHMNDPQKEFLYQDLTVESCRVDAANSSCNLFGKKKREKGKEINYLFIEDNLISCHKSIINAKPSTTT